MRKILISTVIAFFIFLLVFAWGFLYNKKGRKVAKQESSNTQIAEVIEDDCTEEYEYDQKVGSLTANSEQEKISPNAVITYKKIYEGCKHEIIEQKSISAECINNTKEEFQKKYNGWNIEEFFPNKITISKKFNGNCGEEFVLRDKDGVVVIYKINEENKEEEYEKTDIATDYLAEEDKENMKEGLKIIGKQELNKIIEDFE